MTRVTHGATNNTTVAVDYTSWTTLHYAAYRGNLKAVCRTLKAAWKNTDEGLISQTVDDGESKGRTALHLAVVSNQSTGKTRLAVVDLLCRFLANITKRAALSNIDSFLDLKDNQGQTALHRAVRNRDLAIVDMLCQYGSDVTIKDNEGRKPVDLVGAKSEDYQLDNRIIEILNERIPFPDTNV